MRRFCRLKVGIVCECCEFIVDSIREPWISVNSLGQIVGVNKKNNPFDVEIDTVVSDFII